VITNLDYFGLYEWPLAKTDSVVHAVCKKYKLDYDEIYELARKDLEEKLGESPTNWIIWHLFDHLKGALSEQIEPERIDYEVNGICSDFYVDEEQAY